MATRCDGLRWRRRGSGQVVGEGGVDPALELLGREEVGAQGVGIGLLLVSSQ